MGLRMCRLHTYPIKSAKQYVDAWKFFAQLNRDKARCLVDGCGKELGTKGGSTGSMIKHFSSQHAINKSNHEELLPKKQNLFTKYVSKHKNYINEEDKTSSSGSNEWHVASSNDKFQAHQDSIQEK
ncbi:MAG: hypothetical protein MHMPM18_000503 [Marteilia pararefringens]